MAGDDLTVDVKGQESPGNTRIVRTVRQYLELLDQNNSPDLEAFLARHRDIADVLRPICEGLMASYRSSHEAIRLPSRSNEPEIGTKPIGDFQIVGELGRGGMGIVYEAIQLSLGRRVALKVLPFASGLDEVRLQRFRNEAHAAAALHHTNIVPVFAVGSDRGVHYYAMQLIEGHTLAEVIDNMRQVNGKAQSHAARSQDKAPTITAHSSSQIRTSERTTSSETVRDSNQGIFGESTLLDSNNTNRMRYYRSAVRMIVQAALALEHAHQCGVIHRDIKPANLLIDASGKVWVTDFGLAQVQQDESNLTRTGDPLGTLRYMSPEQAAGNRAILDHRTDIYSLGVTLYELLTLEPAIRGEGYREMLNQVAEHEPPTPKSIDPMLPNELDTIVRKAISKASIERYVSAGALADDLQRWLDDKPIAAKPPTVIELVAKWRRRNSGLVAAAGGLLAIAALGLVALLFVVWREQTQTHQALQNETKQRELAERSFQQARAAVDSFSQLSESELAHRPDLQDLRRTFLDASLEFYRDFVEQHRDTPKLAQELEQASQRVKRLVDEIGILEDIQSLLLLRDRSVRRDVKLGPIQATTIDTAINTFQTKRMALASQSVASLDADNEELSVLLADFDQYISEQLTSEQMNRLKQIARQKRLPFTFKSTEVVNALKLTREQQASVNRIIEETRPNRIGQWPPLPRNQFKRMMSGLTPKPPKPGDSAADLDLPDGPPPGDPPDDFAGAPPPPDEKDRPESLADGSPGNIPFGQTAGRVGFGMGPAGLGDGLGGAKRTPFTKKTVEKILEILTPEQLVIWQALVGEPFEG